MFQPDKEKLTKIPELSDFLFELMTDSKFSQFVGACEEFVNSFPDLQQKIQASDGSRALFARHLSSLCEMLDNIGANNFVCVNLQKSAAGFFSAAEEIVTLRKSEDVALKVRVSEIRQKAEDALIGGSWKGFLESYTDISKMLKELGADSVIKQETAALSKMFLTPVSALSIDIQIASHMSGEAPKKLGILRQIVSGDASADASYQTILAVDDSSFLLTRLKSDFSDMPYKIICKKSGAEALAYLQKNFMPDLFLIDAEMPVMDGYQLAAKIRETGCGSPMVFLTENATTENISKALRAGAADIIVKPINKTYMLEHISKLLK